MSLRTWIPLCIYLLIRVGMDDAQLTVKQESNAGNALRNMQFKNSLQRALNDLQKLRPEAYHYSGAKKGFLSAYNFPQYPYKVEQSAGSNFLDLAENEERIVRNAARSKREALRVLEEEKLQGSNYSDCRQLPFKIVFDTPPKSDETHSRPRSDITNDASLKPEDSSLSSQLPLSKSYGDIAKRDTTYNDDHSRPEVIKLSKRQPQDRIEHNQSVERTNANGTSSSHRVIRSLNAQPSLEVRGRPGRSINNSKRTDLLTGGSLPKTHEVNIQGEKDTVPSKDSSEDRISKRGKREISSTPDDPRSLRITDNSIDGEENHDTTTVLPLMEPRSFNQDEEGGNEADEEGSGVEGAAPSRRFLFSPSISNTITNLNQNTNTNTNVIHHAPATIDDEHPAQQKWIPKKPIHQPVVPYPFYGPNPFGNLRKSSKMIDKEFDLRGTGLKKVCFLL